MSERSRPSKASMDWAATHDDVVWSVCEYLDVGGNGDCLKCPTTEDHPKLGPSKRGCRGLTEECVAMVRDAVLRGYAE